MGVPGKRKLDGVAVLESAYDLTRDDAGWLDGLSRALAPMIDRGMGVAAFIGRVDGSFVVDADAGPLGAEARQATETEMVRGRRFVDTVFRGVPGFFSMAGLLGPAFGDLAAQVPIIGKTGANDVAFIRALNLDGSGCLFGSPSRVRVRQAGEGQARRARHLAMHIASAFRLRRSLLQPSGDGEAVLAPGGKLLDAAGAARAPSARDALRAAVVAMDRARGRLRRWNNEEAIDLWQGLVAAQWTLVDRFEADGRRFIVAHRNEPPVTAYAGLSMPERQVAAHAAAGLPNKLIAYGLGLSMGAVADLLRRVGQKLGLKRRVDLIALGSALGVAWSSGPGLSTAPTASAIRVGAASTEIAFAATSVPRAASRLTPAQLDVAHLLVTGRSQSQIAALRGVSPRTVANQVAAIYDRLRLGGRADLVAYMAGRITADESEA